MIASPPLRIQLCGPLTVRRGLEDLAAGLPGPQGRLLFARLVLSRTRELTREELADALWGECPPGAPGPALRALLSRLRGALGEDVLGGRDRVVLRLPATSWVDVEASVAAIHDAESAIALGNFRRAWVAAHIAMNVAGRELLAGHDRPWIDALRRDLEVTRLRAHEALASAGLALGGPELATALRSAAAVVAAAPRRESAHALLMDALTAQGNAAEALAVYETIRDRLDTQLGATPGQLLRDAHFRALGAGRT